MLGGKRKREGTPIQAVAILQTDANRYFVERDSAAFRSLLAKTLNLSHYKFEEAWRDGDSVFVRLITKPEVASWVPSAVRNAAASSTEIEFNDIIEYRMEDISYPPYRLHVRTESPFLGQKLHVRTTLTIEDMGGGRSRQTLSGVVHVRILGIGRVVEKLVCESIQNTYKRLPEIVEKWEAFRQEAIRRGDPFTLVAGRPPIGGGDAEWIQNIMQAPCGSNASKSNQANSIKDLVNENAKSSLEEMEMQATPGGRHHHLNTSGKTTSCRCQDSQEEAPSTGVLERKRTDLDSAFQEGFAAAAVPVPLDDTEGGIGEHSKLVVMKTAKHVREGEAEKMCASIGGGGHDAKEEIRFRVQHQHHLESTNSNPKQGSGSLFSNMFQPLIQAAAHRRDWSVDSSAIRGFNADYAAWFHYWNVEVGVRAIAVHKGAMRAVHAAMMVLQDCARTLLVLLLVLILRSGILRIVPYSFRQRSIPRHRRVQSAPGMHSATSAYTAGVPPGTLDTGDRISPHHARHFSLPSSTPVFLTHHEQETRPPPSVNGSGIEAIGASRVAKTLNPNPETHRRRQSRFGVLAAASEQRQLPRPQCKSTTQSTLAEAPRSEKLVLPLISRAPGRRGSTDNEEAKKCFSCCSHFGGCFRGGGTA